MIYDFGDNITRIVFWKLYDEAKEKCIDIVLNSSKKCAIELLERKMEEILREYNIPEDSLSEYAFYSAIGWASYEEIAEAFERVYYRELEEEAEANLIGGENEEYFEEYYEEPEED